VKPQLLNCQAAALPYNASEEPCGVGSHCGSEDTLPRGFPQGAPKLLSLKSLWLLWRPTGILGQGHARRSQPLGEQMGAAHPAISIAWASVRQRLQAPSCSKHVCASRNASGGACSVAAAREPPLRCPWQHLMQGRGSAATGPAAHVFTHETQALRSGLEVTVVGVEPTPSQIGA
jgi:hypothetical protein